MDESSRIERRGTERRKWPWRVVSLHHTTPRLFNMSSTANPYKDDVDFAALALKDDDFAKV